MNGSIPGIGFVAYSRKLGKRIVNDIFYNAY
jgi:hypothetical protein